MINKKGFRITTPHPRTDCFLTFPRHTLRRLILIRKPILAGMRTIALFEAAKGALVLLAGLGLLALIHRDVQVVAEKLVRMSHLNPASHYPRIFILASRHVSDTNLRMLAIAAGLYALVRWVEAYGLWLERRWAAWFALIASGIYLPVEIYQMVHHLTWIKVAIFATNVLVVVYMAWALLHPDELNRERADDAPEPKAPPEKAD